jgi:hypothetical protein
MEDDIYNQSAFQLGKQMKKEGRGINSNPFPHGSMDAIDFNKGYYFEETDIESNAWENRMSFIIEMDQVMSEGEKLLDDEE